MVSDCKLLQLRIIVKPCLFIEKRAASLTLEGHCAHYHGIVVREISGFVGNWMIRQRIKCVVRESICFWPRCSVWSSAVTHCGLAMPSPARAGE